MDQRNPQNQPIRDLGSFVGHIPSDADIKGNYKKSVDSTSLM